MLVLVSALLVLLLAMTLFTVDVSYMQLTRSELRSASDAAAKAGAEALRRTKDPALARQAAIQVANLNTVGGRPLLLRDQDIVVGNTTLQSDGSWDFTADAAPYTAVQVNAQMGGTSPNAAVKLFFADVFGSGTFEPVRTSTAAHTAVEICLCIDRSHSMCFDLSGVDWTYPPGTPMWPHPICYPPHPTHSRWGVLMRSVQGFANVIKSQNPKPRVALVTWASEITTSTAEYRLTGRTSPAVTLDLPLTTSHGDFVSSLNGRSAAPVLGGTNMSTGMDKAFDVLTDSDIDPLANRIMILMSDGQWNQGSNPLTVAEKCKSKKVIVHTISFLSAANSSTLEGIATITGGRFYEAANAEQLNSAFLEIARQLPVVLTD